jgi:hypothetical protein
MVSGPTASMPPVAVGDASLMTTYLLVYLFILSYGMHGARRLRPNIMKENKLKSKSKTSERKY